MAFLKHILLVSFFILSVLFLNAQNKTGALIGKVKDAYYSNAIKNASVTLLGNNKLFQTETNEKGIYEFSQLPVGVYSVIIRKDNFKINELLNFINITEDTIITIGFKLIPIIKVENRNINALSKYSCSRCCDVYLPKNYINYNITNWVKHADIEEFYSYSYKKINSPISFNNNSITNSNPFYITQLRIASDYFAVKQ
jgi:hypothetical protein